MWDGCPFLLHSPDGNLHIFYELVAWLSDQLPPESHSLTHCVSTDDDDDDGHHSGKRSPSRRGELLSSRPALWWKILAVATFASWHQVAMVCSLSRQEVDMGSLPLRGFHGAY